MLLLNKIDLVPEEGKLKKLEARLRSLNKWAPIERCQDASVALEKILSIRGFELDRVLEMDPEFLNVDGEHMHDDRVTSVGFRLDGELDMDKTNAWIAKLLQLSGKDIFRMKGVLAMAGMDEKFVYQGVHMQFKGEFSEPWGDEKPNCRLIFIGRDLDKAMITSGFQACKNVHQYILEKDIGSTTLRFKVGDTVLAKSSATDFSKGVVKAIFHKEPQFPPGHVVPYQIQLEGEGGAEGTTVYSPADTDDFVRPIGDVSAGVGAMKIE